MRSRNLAPDVLETLQALRRESGKPGRAVVCGPGSAGSVGRLHKRQIVLEDIARLRATGIANINVDLIAGLPHQTAESWDSSSSPRLIASGAPHVSVYMLEIDEDSRLGRELIAGGTKYHAHFVPDEDLTADLYETACARLEAAGIRAV